MTFVLNLEEQTDFIDSLTRDDLRKKYLVKWILVNDI